MIKNYEIIQGKKNLPGSNSDSTFMNTNHILTVLSSYILDDKFNVFHR